MKIQRISRIPGSEPVLLDLEKLFLLSDSMESSDKTKFFGKTIFNCFEKIYDFLINSLRKI